ncbi:hypothetical protein J1N35_034313 [Gossypium stocksii]|uniref:RNase H type-1 domain-containing protein n=1 Tax=Gossypium stocksii TaxID=47602 RepID=A0A9D3URW6_9ROSI|nr:hypothetical protein J1N35_034313 [Gossypium stocksii]
MREIGWKHWLATDFESQSTEACKLRFITFRAVWYNRNKLYHEGIQEQVTDVVGFIRAYYAKISFMGERLQNTSIVKDPIWEPPDIGIIKINFDAAFYQATTCSISGFIARNDEGLIMAAGTYLWENISDSVMAEARACLQAIIMAEEMGF